MPGLGTMINCAAILAGGMLGIILKRGLGENYQSSLLTSCGLATIFLGVCGTLQRMLLVNADLSLSSGGTMLIIFSLCLGGLAGEFLDLQGKLEQFGIWLRKKSGSEKDSRFLDGFLTASFTVCIGAMAVVGSIQDGIHGDYSILAAKSVLDFVIIAVMTSSLGKGCIFSAIPVGIFQGSVTVLSSFLEPVFTEQALNGLSLVGNILIFCVGINILFDKKIRVANMLPALIFAVIFSFVL